MSDPGRGAVLGLVIVGGSFERAHAALLMAVGAAAMDRAVVVFATGRGVLALCRDWSGLDGADGDAVLRDRGVAGLDALRNAARELGVRLMACESGLRGAGIAADALLDGVERSGVPSFLLAAGTGQLLAV
ncbi:MAG: DsrE/DsrF/DrsH-like family protein [Gluconacetobacter diazotrophicus]|nr:DsrE/DsrF/DrsH-like family protein [Gluconacetobacter diazotrophicus]